MKKHIYIAQYICAFCKKEYKYQKCLDNHVSAEHSIQHNNLNLSFNNNVVNVHKTLLKSSNTSVLKTAAHLSRVDKNISTSFDKNSKLDREFVTNTKFFCKKYNTNFIISLINIRSLRNKVNEISFLLIKDKGPSLN